MCGINGIVSVLRESGDYNTAVNKMNNALKHRGPDDAGIYNNNGVSLGQRRLSIIDLSSAGHQPMQSADERYVLAYNGEIYNFKEIRSRLDYPFTSNSDTEVLLAAWQTWGADCIDYLVGMFAFAVWDRKEQELHLVRDRLGIKPLYYYQDEERIVFSSEVRSILSSDLVPRKLNEDAVYDFLRYQCVHQPSTIVDGIKLLMPGSHLQLKGGELKIVKYWNAYKSGVDTGIDVAGARKAVYEALLKSVERRLVADVPFGAFLSGGIDSSAIVALMSRLSDKVNTFSISFAEEEFSEARYARIIADKFNTEHHEIQLSPDDFLALLPEALDSMDHPSGDGPNTYVVSKATKDAGITMALSGLGGDELFAGYSIFTQSMQLEKQRWLNVIPRIIRSGMGQVLKTIKPSISSEKISGILSNSNITALSAYPFYRQVILDNQIHKMTTNKNLPDNRVSEILNGFISEPEFIKLPQLSQISIAEMSTYMQNVLLRDTDQMSMAHALEVRVPFLDHELVELVVGLPDKIKYPHSTKQLLVESLGDLLPTEIVDRPKMGFSLPYAHWMKNELFDFCYERIKKLAARPLFNEDVIFKYWNDFIQGSATISWSRLWALVVLEHWLDKNNVS